MYSSMFHGNRVPLFFGRAKTNKQVCPAYTPTSSSLLVPSSRTKATINTTGLGRRSLTCPSAPEFTQTADRVTPIDDACLSCGQPGLIQESRTTPPIAEVSSTLPVRCTRTCIRQTYTRTQQLSLEQKNSRIGHKI